MTRNASTEDRLGDFTADARLITLSIMAAAIGVLSAGVAWALVRLIGLFTNLAYFHRLAERLVLGALREGLGHRVPPDAGNCWMECGRGGSLTCT